MIYGYARISTRKQSIERQIRNIRAAYPSAVILSEAYTGTTIDRPEWTKLMAHAVKGDTIVFDSVSRMSRNAEEGVTVYEQLFNIGIELIFLKEPQINTSTYKKALENSVPMTGTSVDYILAGVNRYLMALAKEQIRLAFFQAEKEVSDLRQRTREGIITAKLNGKTIGRPQGFCPQSRKYQAAKKIILEYSKDFNGTLNDPECMRLAGISRNTFYRYKAKLKRE